MNKALPLILITMALVACRVPATLPPTPSLPEPDMTMPVPTDPLHDLFNSFIEPNEPGAIVLVMRGGEIVHLAAFGMANLETATPLTPEHQMHIASTAKQMTALAIMLLAHDGMLAYDDPVGVHIPELEHFGDDFTIRDLLTHTSGLPDYDDDLLDELMSMSDAPDNEDLIAALSEWEGPPNVPGQAFEYSNPGYDLLGSIIERASGLSFPEFMRARIFEPLAMRHTFSVPDEARRAGPLVAMSYTDQSGRVEAYPADPLDNLVGSGSIYTTAGDMARYDEALYRETLLPVSAFDEAFTPVILSDGGTEPYGFGWEIEAWNGEPYVAHSGAWLGFQSDYVRFVNRQLSVLVMLNRDYNVPEDPRLGLQVAQFFLK